MPDAAAPCAGRNGGGWYRDHAAAVQGIGPGARHYRWRLSYPLARTVSGRRARWPGGRFILKSHCRPEPIVGTGVSRTLRNFGLKVGMVGKMRFEARIKELVESLPDLAELVEPLLIVRRTLRGQIVILHRRLLAIVRDDEVCQRLMTTPGVGPVVALTYRATVDVPARFRKSKAVGAVFGLTCARYQSGEIDWSGRISRCGDEMMRVMLYEAAQSMLRSKKWSWLKAWAMQIARRRGMKKAIVALARRLAVIMHRIWVDGTEFRWTREQAAA